MEQILKLFITVYKVLWGVNSWSHFLLLFLPLVLGHAGIILSQTLHEALTSGLLYLLTHVPSLRSPYMAHSLHSTQIASYQRHLPQNIPSKQYCCIPHHLVNLCFSLYHYKHLALLESVFLLLSPSGKYKSRTRASFFYSVDS